MLRYIRYAFVLTALWIAASAVQAQPPTQFNLPAQPLADALQAVASRTGTNVLFDPPVVANRMAPALNAKLTCDEALVKLLAGTGLKHEFLSERTVAIRVARHGSSSSAMDPAEQMRVAVAAADEKKKKTASEERNGMPHEEQSKPQDLVVTGSRIRSSVDEQTVQPVLTITSQDIERYGVSSLGEVLRQIPQVSNFEQGQGVTTAPPNTFFFIAPAEANLTSGRVTATLRGAPAGGTLLLINGRRAPKGGQKSGTDGYDLSAIPLAAIERIDILLDGASAVYGADAVGGVINVILKRDYRGTDVRVGYENTFDRDTAVTTASLSHGFATEKFSGSVNLSGQRSNDLKWPDRSFLRTWDRTAWGGEDSRSTGFIAGTGRISVSSGNLPGLATSAVTIPEGSMGIGTTAQEYDAAGPVPGIQDLGQFSYAVTPFSRKSALASLEYRWVPAVTLFGDVHWGRSHTWSALGPIRLSNTMPADAPGNPFGVPVRVNKFFFDVPEPRRDAVLENYGVVAGARGPIGGTWRYEAAVSKAESDSRVTANSGVSISTTLLNNALNSATPPVLLYDSTRLDPQNPPGTLEALTIGAINDREVGTTWTYDAKVDGELFELPAGPVRVAAGMEYREELIDFPLQSPTAMAISPHDRYASGAFLEARIPLVSPGRQWSMLDRLELSLAARHDEYSDFDASTNLRYGLLYRPASWIMLRASYGEGYKVPRLSELYAPVVVRSNLIFLDTDPMRGETVVGGPLPTTFGGNPNLQPEQSLNRTVGVVIDVLPVEGLSLAVDYYDTDYVDRIGGVSVRDRILQFPDTLTRGPKLPDDPADWLGPVVAVDIRSVNVASNRIAGVDITAKFNRAATWGDLAATVMASKALRNEVRAVRNAPLDTFTTEDSIPLRLAGSLFLMRGGFEVGTVCIYRDQFRANTFAAFTPSVVKWDVQFGYEFAEQGGGFSMSQLLAGTRIAVTVHNVFDREPPIGPGGMPDVTVIDAQMRRYAVQLTKRF